MVNEGELKREDDEKSYDVSIIFQLLPDSST